MIVNMIQPSKRSLLKLLPLCIISLVWMFGEGCKRPTPSNPYPYTAEDFSTPLRNLLRKIEQHNIVYSVYSGCRGSGPANDSSEIYFHTLGNIASTDDLLKASKCTNPTVRASALQILLLDSAINPVPLIGDHMYDTAIVFDDYSNAKWTVVSLALTRTRYWRNKADRDVIEKELLENQPYELASYYLLDKQVDTFPGFYQIVRKMARKLNDCDFNSIVNWYSGQGALVRLASYRYQEDVMLLDTLFESSLHFSNGHFFPAKAIKKFSAPEFEKYYLDTSIGWTRLFRFLRTDDYFRFEYGGDAGVFELVNLVVKHKSVKSAMLLENILNFSPYELYGVAGRGIKGIEEKTEKLYRYIGDGIRVQTTPHYYKLLKLTEKYQGEYLDYYPKFENGPDSVENNGLTATDTIKPFREFWWR